MAGSERLAVMPLILRLELFEPTVDARSDVLLYDSQCFGFEELRISSDLTINICGARLEGPEKCAAESSSETRPALPKNSRSSPVTLLDWTRITKQSRPKYSCEFPPGYFFAKPMVTPLSYREDDQSYQRLPLAAGKGHVSVPLET